MAEPIRFFMDQHFPGPVSQGVRRHGVDVLTAQEAQRCGLPDADQLAFATTEGRVMVTFDTDFLALHQSGVQHAGIAWCPEQKHSIGHKAKGDIHDFRNHECPPFFSLLVFSFPET